MSLLSCISRQGKFSKYFYNIIISKISKISEISEISKISRISKISKISKISTISNISKISKMVIKHLFGNLHRHGGYKTSLNLSQEKIWKRCFLTAHIWCKKNTERFTFFKVYDIYLQIIFFSSQFQKFLKSYLKLATANIILVHLSLTINILVLRIQCNNYLNWGCVPLVKPGALSKLMSIKFKWFLH